jgi:hypothetical protein
MKVKESAPTISVSRDPRLYLQDIAESIQDIENYTQGMTYGRPEVTSSHSETDTNCPINVEQASVGKGS